MKNFCGHGIPRVSCIINECQSNSSDFVNVGHRIYSAYKEEYYIWDGFRWIEEGKKVSGKKSMLNSVGDNCGYVVLCNIYDNDQVYALENHRESLSLNDAMKLAKSLASQRPGRRFYVAELNSCIQAVEPIHVRGLKEKHGY